MRILGLDFGSKTLGVAVSDPFLWTAQGVMTIKRKDENNLKETLAELRKIVEGYEVTKIILGYPYHMNHTEGPRCEKTQQFKARLEKELHVEVLLWDERSSTKASEKILLEADISRKKRKDVIDKMAAVFILQGYLDSIQSF